jgi:hypothetical protein
MKKSNAKIWLAPLKVLINFENPFNNLLQSPLSGILTLKMLTGSRL